MKATVDDKAVQEATERLKRIFLTSRQIAPGLWGKYGLTSRCGIVPYLDEEGGTRVALISQPYDADGKVFVGFCGPYPDQPADCDDEWDQWKRVDPSDVGDQKVICCSHPDCQLPAVRLDHQWPYCIDMTNCADHIDWFMTDVELQEERER